MSQRVAIELCRPTLHGLEERISTHDGKTELHSWQGGGYAVVRSCRLTRRIYSNPPDT